MHSVAGWSPDRVRSERGESTPHFESRSPGGAGAGHPFASAVVCTTGRPAVVIAAAENRRLRPALQARHEFIDGIRCGNAGRLYRDGKRGHLARVVAAIGGAATILE